VTRENDASLNVPVLKKNRLLPCLPVSSRASESKATRQRLRASGYQQANTVAIEIFVRASVGGGDIGRLSEEQRGKGGCDASGLIAAGEGARRMLSVLGRVLRVCSERERGRACTWRGAWCGFCWLATSQRAAQPAW
jgi:hypothetical protein